MNVLDFVFELAMVVLGGAMAVSIIVGLRSNRTNIGAWIGGSELRDAYRLRGQNEIREAVRQRYAIEYEWTSLFVPLMRDGEPIAYVKAEYVKNLSLGGLEMSPRPVRIDVRTPDTALVTETIERRRHTNVPAPRRGPSPEPLPDQPQD